ncbi:MAG: hypothetical protein AAF916_13015, partial [Planctomycetota bacterium]
MAGVPVAERTTGAPLVDYADFESPQRFEMNTHEFRYYTSNGVDQTPTYGRLNGTNDPGSPSVATNSGNDTSVNINPNPVAGATIRRIVGVIAAADPPSSWTGGSEIGVNVSEPIPYQTPPVGRAYYPQPTYSLDPGRNFPVDAYHDYTDAGSPPLPDRPFDENPATSELHRVFGDQGVRTATRDHFKTAYLQRLADPTQPYDPEFNPYRTIDYITIDLTVFNGSDDSDDTLLSAGPDMMPGTGDEVPLYRDPSDEDPYANNNGPLGERFGTRYKTGRPIDQDPSTNRDANLALNDNLVYSVNTFPAPVSTPNGEPVNFPFDLSLDPFVIGDPDDAGGSSGG